jgi:hypothetical protein
LNTLPVDTSGIICAHRTILSLSNTTTAAILVPCIILPSRYIEIQTLGMKQLARALFESMQRSLLPTALLQEYQRIRDFNSKRYFHESQNIAD